MRSASIYRRCTRCGGRFEAPAKGRPACARCRSSTFSWAFIVDVAPRGAPRKQRARAGFPTKEAVLAAAAELQAAVASGGYVAPSRRTVRSYLVDEWLPAVRPPAVRGGTWRGYRDNLTNYVIPRIGDMPLQQLTRASVKAMYADLAAAGGRKGRALSVKSVHNVHLMLRRALRDAVADLLIPANPADGAHSLPRDRGLEMRTWSADELGRFLTVTHDSDWHPMWRLAATTGMRRGELLGLRWRDTDLEAGRVQIVQQRVRLAEGLGYGPPKTAKGRRRIDLDPTTVAAVRQHRRRQAEDRLGFGPGYDSEADLVFARPDGSPIDPDVVSTAFERQARRAGMPHIRFHDLRHTHATLALAAGIHPKVVQERLGHSSVAITMDIYSHAIPAMQADAATRIAAIVDGALEAAN